MELVKRIGVDIVREDNDAGGISTLDIREVVSASQRAASLRSRKEVLV